VNRRALGPLALLAFLGCGGIAVVDGEAGNPPKTTTTMTMTGTTTMTLPPDPKCERTTDSFSAYIETFDGGVFGCNGGSGSSKFLDGLVVDSQPGLLVIDSCPPGADCPMWINVIGWAADGLDVPTVPWVGSFVQVGLEVDMSMGCGVHLMIRALASWDGVPNPFGPEEYLWLAGADGSPTAPQGAPFSVTSLPLGCYPDEQQDDHLLRFEAVGSQTLDLQMGEKSGFNLSFGSDFQVLSVRNLRSYDPAIPDDYANWGYYLFNRTVDLP
jgi:hypothetical protein